MDEVLWIISHVDVISLSLGISLSRVSLLIWRQVTIVEANSDKLSNVFNYLMNMHNFDFALQPIVAHEYTRHT